MNHLSSEKGSILIAALVLVAIMMLLGMSILGASSSEFAVAANELRAAKALNLAEAGVQYGLKELYRHERDLSGFLLPWSNERSLADGRFKVTISRDASDNSLFLIRSEGWLGEYTNRKAYRVITMRVRATVELVKLPYVTYTGAFPLDAIKNQSHIVGDIYGGSVAELDLTNHPYINGTIYINGSVERMMLGKHNSDITGSIYVSGDVGTLEWNESDLAGKVYVSGRVQRPIGVPTGKVVTGSAFPVQPPLPDFVSRDWDKSADLVFAGDTIDFDNLPAELRNAKVIYKPSGSLNLQGRIDTNEGVQMIVAQGDLVVSGDLTYASGAGPITLIGLGGIRVEKHAVVNGMLYTPGILTWEQNKATLYGALIASQFVCEQSMDFEFTIDTRFLTDGVPGSESTTIEIMSWEELQ